MDDGRKDMNEGEMELIECIGFMVRVGLNGWDRLKDGWMT